MQEEDLVAVGGKDGFESNESVLVYGVLFSPKVPELRTSRHSTWLLGYFRVPRLLQTFGFGPSSSSGAENNFYKKKENL